MRQIKMGALASQVCDVARDAGIAILEIYQQGLEGGKEVLVAQKPDESPLTIADLAAHEAICDGLRRLTPGLPIVSEEDAASLIHRAGSGVYWLIDPLDGTKEFLARNGEFTVNIALISDGEPVWGVVFAPAIGQMYWGGRAHGAFRQAQAQTLPISVSAPREDGRCYRVLASKSHLNAETSEFIARLGVVDLVQAGSSLKFCRVAEGLADVYPRLAPTSEWDTAAAQAVLEGAGGYVLDTKGVRLHYGKPDVLNPYFIATSVPLAELGMPE